MRIRSVFLAWDERRRRGRSWYRRTTGRTSGVVSRKYPAPLSSSNAIPLVDRRIPSGATCCSIWPSLADPADAGVEDAREHLRGDRGLGGVGHGEDLSFERCFASIGERPGLIDMFARQAGSAVTHPPLPPSALSAHASQSGVMASPTPQQEHIGLGFTRRLPEPRHAESEPDHGMSGRFALLRSRSMWE
jgi:hypothetical protein